MTNSELEEALRAHFKLELATEKEIKALPTIFSSIFKNATVESKYIVAKFDDKEITRVKINETPCIELKE